MFFQDFLKLCSRVKIQTNMTAGSTFFSYVCLFFRDFVVKPSDYRHMRHSFYPLFICNLIVNTQ